MEPPAPFSSMAHKRNHTQPRMAPLLASLGLRQGRDIINELLMITEAITVDKQRHPQRQQRQQQKQQISNQKQNNCNNDITVDKQPSLLRCRFLLSSAAFAAVRVEV